MSESCTEALFTLCLVCTTNTLLLLLLWLCRRSCLNNKKLFFKPYFVNYVSFSINSLRTIFILHLGSFCFARNLVASPCLRHAFRRSLTCCSSLSRVRDFQRKNVVWTRFSLSMENEQANAGRDGRTRLARPNSHARTGTGEYLFPLFS